jgi:cyclophilin family peptidyl-prolyl cis-trans isomerase
VNKNQQNRKPGGKTYSLTAKERKAQRVTGVKSYVKKTPETDVAADLSEAGLVSLGPGAGERAGLSHTKKMAVILTSVFLALILIVLAILTPTVFYPMIRYGAIDNPVAKIELSNGDVLEFEIYQKEVPNASNNFLYLAKKGFFDGTIIFDLTNKYIRFGQYESYVKSRTENADFLKKIKDITLPTETTSADNVFDYRLYKDTALSAGRIVDKYNSFAYLSQCSGESGVDFQICGKENASETVPVKNSSENPGSPKTMTGQTFGRALQSSQETIEKIVNAELNPDNGSRYWTGPKNTIRIKSVKIYQLKYFVDPASKKQKKWQDFNWDDYFQGNRYMYWHGSSGFSE